MKTAKPNGLIVECPYCGVDNEVDTRDLKDEEFPCQNVGCLEDFKMPSSLAFVLYVNNAESR